MNFDQQRFRQALGRFATGVCVITTQDSNGEYIGMTANSFASVSLEPPLVLWSIQKNSDCFDTFQNNNYYAVNILDETQQDVSNQYAKKNDHVLSERSYRIGTSGMPVLKQAMTSFECRVHERYEGGDHIILVGEVIDVTNRPTGKPLIFFSGQYRSLK